MCILEGGTGDYYNPLGHASDLASFLACVNRALVKVAFKNQPYQNNDLFFFNACKWIFIFCASTV